MGHPAKSGFLGYASEWQKEKQRQGHSRVLTRDAHLSARKAAREDGAPTSSVPRNDWVLDVDGLKCAGGLGFGLVPAAGREDGLIAGAPGVRLVASDGAGLVEDGVDNTPGFFDVVLASEERGVASHGVGEDTLVGFHVPWFRVTGGDHLDGAAAAVAFGVGCADPHRDGHLRTDAHAHVVLRTGFRVEAGGGRAAEARHDLGAGDGKVLAGANVERDAAPAPGVYGELDGGE